MTHCIAVHPGGRVYTVPWMENLEKNQPSGKGGPAQQVDLISFEDPLRTPPRR
jgi:hypothetical protein